MEGLRQMRCVERPVIDQAAVFEPIQRAVGEFTRIGYVLQATAAANIVKAVPVKATPAS